MRVNKSITFFSISLHVLFTTVGGLTR